MSKKKRLIPFKWMPGSWGLVGELYDKAEAAYYYDGDDLTYALVGIQYADKNDPEYLQHIAKLDLETGKISKREFDEKIHDLTTFENDVDKQIDELFIQHKYGDLDDNFYHKAVATLEDKPYVNMLSMGINPDQVVEGYFELDWNNKFVEVLQEGGISGTTDEEIVNKWFNAICNILRIQSEADQDWGMQDEDRGPPNYNNDVEVKVDQEKDDD